MTLKQAAGKSLPYYKKALLIASGTGSLEYIIAKLREDKMTSGLCFFMKSKLDYFKSYERISNFTKRNKIRPYNYPLYCASKKEVIDALLHRVSIIHKISEVPDIKLLQLKVAAYCISTYERVLEDGRKDSFLRFQSRLGSEGADRGVCKLYNTISGHKLPRRKFIYSYNNWEQYWTIPPFWCSSKKEAIESINYRLKILKSWLE